jgi:hypothetical protein
MDKKLKNSKTPSEALAKLKISVLASGQISQFQEMGRKHAKMIESVKNFTQPIIEQMNQIKVQPHFWEPTDFKIAPYRPVGYEILEELQTLNRNNKRLLSSQEDSSVIIYDTKNGSLDRHLGGKCFSYDLTENGKRKKLLEVLLDRGTYVQTKDLAEILSCPTSQAVAKIVQTFNDYAINSLKLNGETKIIQGKKGSGYRINPKIHIEKE